MYFKFLRLFTKIARKTSTPSQKQLLLRALRGSVTAILTLADFSISTFYRTKHRTTILVDYNDHEASIAGFSVALFQISLVESSIERVIGKHRKIQHIQT